MCAFAGQVEDEYVGLAKSLMEKAEAKGVQFLLPEDVVVADKVNRLITSIPNRLCLARVPVRCHMVVTAAARILVEYVAAC